jgi:hypothetical protein
MSALFASFWSGGFESSCHVNRLGTRLDLIAATQHDRLAKEDYQRLREIGMLTARDGVRWPLIDRSGSYNFASFLPMLRAARAAGIQVNWTLCHYGWPDDIDVFSGAFVDRFARYAAAVASLVAGESADVPLYSLINEPSFLAWAAGDGGIFHPRATERGHELKRQIVRATIAGIEAIRSIDRRARFVHVDPMINVVPRVDRPEDGARAFAHTTSQYESWALLTGELEPDLGGRADYLDIAGYNYYHSNQWELGGSRLRWEDHPLDPRWMPLQELLTRAHKRFPRPMLLGETSHFGVGRGRWIIDVSVAVAHGILAGLPIEGICLFPIIDRPDWENLNHWHNSGLWDLEPRSGALHRVISHPYAVALQTARATVQAARDTRRRAGRS